MDARSRGQVAGETVTASGELNMGRPGYNVQYDFAINGETVTVKRNGQELPTKFSTTEKDTKDFVSPLNRFLQSIGRSQVDAHMVCVAVEAGTPVTGVFGYK
jgi:hypothetical protein